VRNDDLATLVIGDRNFNTSAQLWEVGDSAAVVARQYQFSHSYTFERLRAS
jgi:hypothetical protein